MNSAYLKGAISPIAIRQEVKRDLLIAILGNTDLSKVSFQDVKFRNCKMLGLHFDKGNEFGFAIVFEQCLLNH